MKNFTRKNLDLLYSKFNKRGFVHPDPLEFLYHYDNPCDRELVGLVASSLAYGNVKQILKSVSKVLDRMKSPYSFLMDAGRDELFSAFKGFKHRFTTGEEISILLNSAKSAIRKYGSLEGCFMSGYKEKDTDLIPAMMSFVRILSADFKNGETYLLPCPGRGSACKRLNLYMRWMVRKDDVDPGGWDNVPRSKLLVPLDVHMWNICSKAGFTERKQANLKSAVEITAKFAELNPEDPVKYDFCLTRFGIRDELEYEDMKKHAKS
ncbi:MAG TPA: TIGR02757 family protein [Lentisphaeria bacterium]|nr:MAG: TIGR02757 family protein [Lentisphaerae bacterium GWF2_49_21]HBC86779.1 TIGR02757 family protein [Lentisphaeria bacterium]